MTRKNKAASRENGATGLNTHAAAKNADFTPFCDSDDDFRCFPAVEFNAVAIGTSGLLKGKRLTIEKRVITGSWRRADGTRGVHYSYWATYDTVCCGVPMVGYACVPASECAMLSIVVRQERQAA